MKKRTIIIILGIWIAIVPVLGLPNVWKNRTVSVSAIVLVWLAYSRKVASTPANISASATKKSSTETSTSN
ncbi:MAG: hypothetical protein K9M11_04185 [Candidatus Pacebacteria bacterium]|nr:hypothetical protein [Candidatus Paceibacterota bacterium]